MMRLLALGTLLALGACARQPPPPTPAPPPPQASVPTTPAPAPASAPVGVQSETEEATRSQESGDGEAEHSPGDASLEQMAGAPAGAPLPAGKWQPGVNYTVLVPAQPTGVAAGKVEVMEFFWLACPHCYGLEPDLQAWLKSKPSYVEFVRVPVIWQPIHRDHARLYYTLEALGRKDLIAKAFEAAAQQHQALAGSDPDESFRRQQQFATDNGVNGADFARAYNSPAVAANLKRAEDLTQLYRVQSIPLLVVNGRYTTDISQASAGSGAAGKLIELLGDLSAAEHGH